MKTRILLVALLACPAALAAQTAPVSKPTDQAPAVSAAPLPIRRVVLYKTGIGYFEHLGRVRGDQEVTIRFTSGQLNDVLKSLTTIDLGKGQITGISYNSVAPIAQRLGALRLPLNEGSTMTEMLRALRGARVEVTAGATPASGRVLSVEAITRPRGNEAVRLPGFTIVTDAGEVRTFELTPDTRIRVLERDLRQDIGRYLDVIGSAREQDVRSMTIATNGNGERQLFVSYISEVPIWKTTYRLVMGSKGSNPLLQGWAIVDNTIGEDWKNVELSLVAGAPQSFIQEISQPYYGRRPVVPLPSAMLMTPQTHKATLGGVEGGVPGGVVGGVVGGLPDAPPPPPPGAPRAFAGRNRPIDALAPAREAVVDMHQEARNTVSAAAGQDLGDLFEYRIKEPVTLAKNQSALVPIVNAEITSEKVALWTAGQGSTRPLRAVWITNASGLTLDGGSITVIDGNAFAGEGLVEPLKPGERRLVSYAADLGIVVKSDVAPEAGRILRVRAQNGVLTRESEDRATWTYIARNEDDEAAPLVIEHRLRPGWKLAPGQTPAESTVDTERFRVVLEPKKETRLVVREVRMGDTRIAVGDITEALITDVAASGIPTTELQRALRPVLDKRAELAGADRQLEDLRRQQQEIVEDQNRLRENMKALRGSAEEKQLLQRYTRQLDEQETRLEQIRQAMARAATERNRIREELSRLIATISLDVSR